MDKFRIFVWKHKKRCKAESNFPGTPPIGKGKSIFEAIGELIFQLKDYQISGPFEIIKVKYKVAKKCHFRGVLLEHNLREIRNAKD